MRVAEIMQTELVTCPPGVTVREAAATMRARGVGACLVMDGPHLAGIITERDLLRLLAEGHDVRDWPVLDAATREVVLAPPDAEVVWAADEMRRRSIRHLPVGEGDCVVGMVSLRDLFVVAGEVLRLDPNGMSTARDMLAAARG